MISRINSKEFNYFISNFLRNMRIQCIKFNKSVRSTDLINSFEYDHSTSVVYMNIISVQESFTLYDRVGSSVVF